MSQAAPDNRRYQTRRAYRLGVANGILFAIGGAFVDPATVLPAFVSRLTDSVIAVGLISTIGNGGWYLPQLFAARYVQPRRFKRPLYVLSAFLRASGWFIAIPVVYLFGGSRAAFALAGFFLGYSLFSFGGGLGGVAFLDIVAKTVSPSRLGSFFGNRQFWGAVGGIGVGYLVRTILADERIPFPTNYCLLMCLALANFLPGWFAYTLVEEPPGQPGEAQSFLTFRRSAPAAMQRQRDLRLLVLSRVLLGATGIALPFYITYCREALHVPESLVGTYLSVQMAGSVFAVPIWARLNDHKGPRALLAVIACLSLATPCLALLASLLPLPPEWDRLAFGLVFFGLGATGTGSFMGFTNYLFAIAPEPQRALYIGILNTLFSVTTLLPVLGGLVVRFASFQVLFGIAALLGLAGAAAVARLPRANPQG
jgi:hypothetical protein